MYKFRHIVFEDIEQEIDSDCSKWSGICSKCVDKLGIHKFLSGSGSGCCMVEGCENEADYYIDFPENEVHEIPEECQECYNKNNNNYDYCGNCSKSV